MVGSVLVATPDSVHIACIELQLLIIPQHGLGLGLGLGLGSCLSPIPDSNRHGREPNPHRYRRFVHDHDLGRRGESSQIRSLVEVRAETNPNPNRSLRKWGKFG